MYTRSQFTLAEFSNLRTFVDENSFGVLSTCNGTRIFTSPVPFDLREDANGTLFVAGHIARANEMLEALISDNSATITITGSNVFIPAEWFGVRNRIPTWLYESVEISGRLEPVDLEMMVADVNTMIARLQRQYVPGSTWALAEIASHVSSQYLKHIAGYRLLDLSIKSCFRLNQNQGNSPALVRNMRAYGSPAAVRLADLIECPPTMSSL